MPQRHADQDDEQHRKFREALEAKRAHTHMPNEAARNKGVGEAHNDKQQRGFRRKTG